MPHSQVAVNPCTPSNNIQHFEKENGDLTFSYICTYYVCVLRVQAIIYCEEDLAFNYYEVGKGLLEGQEKEKFQCYSNSNYGILGVFEYIPLK